MMLRLTFKEGVGYARNAHGAKLQKSLSIFLNFAGTVVSEARGPGLVVRFNSCIEVAIELEVLSFTDLTDFSFKLLVEAVLSVFRRIQSGGIETEEFDR